MKGPNSARGFTLLEVSLALALMALALGGVMQTLSARVETDRRGRAEALLEEIRQSLYGHAIAHGHLPCPDCRTAAAACSSPGIRINDGKEDGIGEDGEGVGERGEAPFLACATPVGNVPWLTLAVAGRDPWGNRLTYRVSERFARDLPDQAVPFDLGTRGDIDVKAGAGAPGYVSRELAAIVISHGNGAWPPSVDEQENLDGDALFVDRNYSSAEDNRFDDLVTWISSDHLILYMVRARRLP
jgi:prepilin-type N-terminal cleavage/methylation domain-containing protein